MYKSSQQYRNRVPTLYIILLFYRYYSIEKIIVIIVNKLILSLL